MCLSLICQSQRVEAIDIQSYCWKLCINSYPLAFYIQYLPNLLLSNVLVCFSFSFLVCFFCVCVCPGTYAYLFLQYLILLSQLKVLIINGHCILLRQSLYVSQKSPPIVLFLSTYSTKSKQTRVQLCLAFYVSARIRTRILKFVWQAFLPPAISSASQ